MTRSIHPIAALFPMMPEDELRELAKDIKANGLIHPVVKDGETIIDGRNRLAACEIADVEPTFTEFTGGDVATYIVGANLKRRHMDASQRAMVAAKMANMTQGNFSKAASLPVSPVTQQQAASLMNVSERAVRSAKAIEKAAPEIAERVVAGDISVHAAKVVADLPEADRKEISNLPAPELSKVVSNLKQAVRQQIKDMGKQAHAEMAEATKHWSAEKKERFSAERMRQLGELIRLTEHICKLPAPAQYAKTLAKQLEDEELETIEAASVWLDEFATRYAKESKA